ncbi:hypothetical protein MPSEU_000704000 [Mayamaea pseudoterrestris]|nr:hypothetical protein MPSEU_000704000 [Mayamaea pseudoterrestris]
MNTEPRPLRRLGDEGRPSSRASSIISLQSFCAMATSPPCSQSSGNSDTTRHAGKGVIGSVKKRQRTTDAMQKENCKAPPPPNDTSQNRSRLLLEQEYTQQLALAKEESLDLDLESDHGDDAKDDLLSVNDDDSSVEFLYMKPAAAASGASLSQQANAMNTEWSNDHDAGTDVSIASANSKKDMQMQTLHTKTSFTSDDEDLDDEPLISLITPGPKHSTTGPSSFLALEKDKQFLVDQLVFRADKTPTPAHQPMATPAMDQLVADPELEEDSLESAICSLSAAATTTATTSPASTHQHPITPLTSAYLQNLAEICWIIMRDARWRVGPKHDTLFQWERGDDLSVVLALARRYILPVDDDVHDSWVCTCILCRDKLTGNAECESLPAVVPAQHLQQTPCLEMEDDDRSLHLYCRLFYRKGFWFRLDDVYRRYYATKDLQISSSDAPDSAAVDKHLSALQDLCDVLKRLLEKGFIRGFSSEEECGKTVDDSLLSNPERGQVLLRMAGSRRGRMAPCPPGTAIWKQMKSQRPLFPGASSSSYLPVKQHVDSVILQSLARVVLKSSNPQHEPSVAETAHVETRIRQILGNGAMHQLLAGFRLRAEPHRTLARCTRLFLCATSGPGSMRGDGTNGWRSLLNVSKPSPIAGVRFPGIHAWHFAEYPGLKSRFGLSSYPFQKSFRCMPFEETDKNVDDQIFDTHASFVAFEGSLELRAHVDFLLELENALRYNERRLARGMQPLGNGNFEQINEHNVDVLNLTHRCGREDFVHAVWKPCDRVSKLLLSCIERDIAIYSEAPASACHKILAIVAVVAMHVLLLQNERIGCPELAGKLRRPWLRHLWWDASLSYVLWDAIPILEKVNHSLAANALETLLFGKMFSCATMSVIPHIPVMDVKELATLLLSRRTRGKAFVRLFINYRHLLNRARQVLKGIPAEIEELKARQVASVKAFFDHAVAHVIANASIPFSSARELAKPLKQPLTKILRDIASLEVIELGLRLHGAASHKQRPDKYSEWNPTIDTAVANAIVNDENGPGFRCAYIGFEDRDSPIAQNVEEHAMEHYHTGRLPQGDSRGGWRGFHDEGSHVHSLFRIICAAPILGAGWGCGRRICLNSMHTTIHISPFQGSPLDLLVGHGQLGLQAYSFYQTRRAKIDALLSKLECMTDQDISNLVYDSVVARHTYMQSIGHRDPTSVDDISRVRTLSLIAAGLGGKCLASIFKCMCFDYRHFRGGMPDLLLIRASACDNDDDSFNTIDLGDFVGESFSVESQSEIQAKRSQMIIGDEDFLGCSMGDAGATNSFKRNRSWAATSSTSSSPQTLGGAVEISLPERLQLLHNNLLVRVETMLVEVKSVNDRLDPRQHDWLNVLSLHGNARVCKFEKKHSKKREAEVNT